MKRAVYARFSYLASLSILLNAKEGGKKIGPSLVLKVMAGDNTNRRPGIL
jgi:hypothetical protein